MDFKVGQFVKINKEIATKDYLTKCYFGNLEKRREEIIEGKAFKILSLREDTPRGHKVPVPVAVLENFGWIPLEALNPCTSKNSLPALTPGRILKLRGDYTYVVMNSEKAFEVHPLGGKESLSNWNTFTGKHCSRKDFDIIAVYDANGICGFKGIATAVPIWTETTPAREMTVADIEKELGHSIKVVGEDGHEYTF